MVVANLLFSARTTSAFLLADHLCHLCVRYVHLNCLRGTEMTDLNIFSKVCCGMKSCIFDFKVSLTYLKFCQCYPLGRTYLCMMYNYDKQILLPRSGCRSALPRSGCRSALKIECTFQQMSVSQLFMIYGVASSFCIFACRPFVHWFLVSSMCSCVCG